MHDQSQIFHTSVQVAFRATREVLDEISVYVTKWQMSFSSARSELPTSKRHLKSRTLQSSGTLVFPQRCHVRCVTTVIGMPKQTAKVMPDSKYHFLSNAK
eukprot:4734129-Pleurochrysis_carterae.AAC.1